MFCSTRVEFDIDLKEDFSLYFLRRLVCVKMRRFFSLKNKTNKNEINIKGETA